MFDRLKRAVGAGGNARPEPMPSTKLVPVPIVRGKPLLEAEIVRTGPSMGFLDRSGDRARSGIAAPVIMPTVPLRTADADVRAAWGAVAGSVRHLVQNSGWISGSVDQFVAYAIGRGLTPNITPEHELLGWSPKRAKQFASDVEKIFDDWANDPLSADNRGQMTFGQITAACLRGWFSCGEIMAQIAYREGRPGTPYKTGIGAIDPTRVMTPPIYTAQMASVQYGIELDEAGVAHAYWVRPLTNSLSRGVRVPRFLTGDRIGFVHSFVGEPGQVRGISPFASVVEALVQTVSLQDAVLVAAHSAASIVGTITSDLPNENVARALGAEGGNALAIMQGTRATWHEGLAERRAGVSLGSSGNVFHLLSGEKFELHAGKTHYQNYPDHLRALLREISRAAGMPYEMLSGDRSAATYSSGRMGLLDFWGLVELRRAALIEPLCRAALEAVTEEAIDKNFVDYPGGVKAFRKQKSLALKGRWFGPAKPAVDELKSVRASVARLEAGLSSLADETAANGSDWEQTLRQIAHERDTAKKLRVPLAHPTPPPPAPPIIGNNDQ